MIWSISVNGAADVTLSTAGISNPVVKKASLEVGTFAFMLKVASINVACPYNYGDTIRLNQDGACFFIGRVRYVEASFESGTSFWTVTVCDSWWELERTMYRTTAIAYQNPPYTTRTGYLSTRTVLNQDSWGRKITLQAQLQNAIIYAATQNPGIIGGFSVPVYGYMPAEEVSEISVAMLISKACSLSAGYYPVPIYINGIYQLGFTTRGATTVPIDLNLATRLVGVRGLKRDDASRPPGIVIDFLQDVVQTVPPGQTVTRLVRQFAGAPGRAGTIYSTITLGPCETVPANVALEYWSALQTPQWSGAMQLQDNNLQGDLYPGITVNFTNGRPEWATMNAVIKACAYDLESGTTDIDFGPPEILQIDGFVEQMMRWRNYPATQSICQVNNNGTEGTDTGVDDEGNEVPAPPPNQPDPNNPDSGGQGVSSPATGVPPGATPTPNPNAGKPSAAVNTGNNSTQFFGTAELTLCDGSQLSVLTNG
jgi:hypothetical protein